MRAQPRATPLTYDAFISHRNCEPDRTIAIRLQERLSRYRVARALVRKGAPAHIGSVFRHDLEQPGRASLSPEVAQALLASRYLIVVCSPRTPASAWVSTEIATFRSLGRATQVLALLIEGEPAEAFPRPLRELNRGGVIEEVEPLAADIRAPDLRRSLQLLKRESLRLIAPLLGFRFDDLRQRHRERLVRRIAAAAALAVVAGASVFTYSYVQWQRADQAIRVATAARHQAETARQEAQSQTAAAELQTKEAENQRAEADRQTQEANTQTVRAELGQSEALRLTGVAQERTQEADAQRLLALEERDRAMRNQSLFLADASRRQLAAGDHDLAILLALEALPRPGSPRPYVRPAENALYAALHASGGATIRQSHYGGVESASFSPDGRLVATASDDQTAQIWDVVSGKHRFTLIGHEFYVRAAIFSPDGNRIATTSWDHTARIWDVATGRQLAVLRGHQSCVENAAWSPDGRRLLTGSWDGSARLWDAETGQALAVLQGDPGWINQVAFSRDGRRILTASGDHTARVWDAQTGALVAKFVHQDEVWDAAFSPDGRRVATASNDGTSRLWDVATGSEVALLVSGERSASRVAFSPDGTRIALSVEDGTVRIFDAATGRQTAARKVGYGWVPRVAFSPDSRSALLVTGKEARIVDAASAEDIALLSGHAAFLIYAAFSPDGGRIVTTDQGGSFGLWLSFPTTEQLVAYAGGVVPRQLTAAERRQFFLDGR